MDKFRLRWLDVTYEPGELKAVAYKDGKKIGETTMCTAGEPESIRLTPDRKNLSPISGDLSYILVEAIDAKGNPCPLADNLVHFEVNGPAVIAGVGNGNPMSFEPFAADYRKLFYGKAMLIIKTTGNTGKIEVAAKADGLKGARIDLQCSDDLLKSMFEIFQVFGIK